MSEIRDGFLVTDGRKKLWDVELDLIELVEKICKENGLNYFLIGGSAIGAVRHGGFIPWDDDMDIGMLRNDFEKFVSVFKNYKRDDVILEYGCNDITTRASFLRIRNINTTAIIKSQYKVKREHGVYIEIYPFDTAVLDEAERKKQAEQSAKLKTELDYRFSKIHIGKKAHLRHLYYSFISDEKLWKKWCDVCTRYNNKDTGMVDTIALPGYAKQGIHLYHLEDVLESEYVDYNNHKVRVAKGNDRCLKIHFGDYMQMPPVEQRGMKHALTVFFDAFTPWTVYMDQKKDIVDRFFAGEYKLCNIW